MYKAWETKEQLELWKEVRGSSWWQYYPWSSSRTAVQWTWTQAITGVWFQPKMITIQAVYAATWWQISFWHASTTANDYCVYMSTWSAWATSYNPARIIDVWSARAEFTSMDTDWFTINWTSATVDCNFIFQCFW
jgi:hypothetical protein